MSKLHLHIPHQLSQEEALGRIKNMLGNLKSEQKNNISNVKEAWEGNTGHFSFTAKGFNLTGKIHVNASDVEIKSDLPFAVSFFKGMISSMITEKAKALLS